MARRTNKPIMVYIDKAGDKQLYWPYGCYDRAEKVAILNKLAEMAKLVELDNSIKKFEDWKKDPHPKDVADMELKKKVLANTHGDSNDQD